MSSHRIIDRSESRTLALMDELVAIQKEYATSCESLIKERCDIESKINDVKTELERWQLNNLIDPSPEFVKESIEIWQNTMTRLINEYEVNRVKLEQAIELANDRLNCLNLPVPSFERAG
jgi:SMC interacting uncharacterized protein involved in chromosome segregation